MNVIDIVLVMQGNASAGERARNTGAQANELVDCALGYISRDNVLPAHPPPSGNRQRDVSPSYESLVDASGRFVPNRKVLELRQRLIKFMETHIYPMEKEFSKLAQSDMRWTVHPEEERLKEEAKRQGLWNLFIPVSIISLQMFTSSNPE